ncbi:hypothetical protein MSMAC_1863 [Methanosarcina mazei C16]|uniref:4Fe-4S ferredoxin-type domain-containing protein n=2 Tax=Methanosarcina mazei TaxID=2209 RepID=A0A0E3S036_METMZ|nr:hypothetical protein MSMAC_1863 [Methanosarcina mazei C16]
MNKSNVMLTRELNLCVSCEICVISCPKKCIDIEYKFGQFLPKVNSSVCIKCGVCLNSCPGIDIDPLNIRNQTAITEEMLDVEPIESYTGYTNNLNIRQICTSGGLITSLAVELIRKKEFDGVFVLKFHSFRGESARLMLTDQIDEILNSSKSKYIPVSVYNVIMELKKRSNEKYVIIGTPCQISGIKKYLKTSSLNENNLLFLGLFCDKTLNFNIVKYFEERYRKSNESMNKFEFRTKEKYGWPGNLKLYFDSGREVLVDRNERMRLKSFFQLNRCLFCYDKLNMFADISFGDCYIKGKEDLNGKSSIVVRTKEGSEILGKYSYLFNLEKEKIEEIRKSQNIIDKAENIENIKILSLKDNISFKSAIISERSNTNNKIESSKLRLSKQRLARLQRHIKWGMNYNKSRIKSYLFIYKTYNIGKKMKKAISLSTVLGLTVVRDILESILKKRSRNFKDIPKKNVIIVGGELFNKGAQAMTFTTVDQIRRRFPDKNIYLFSTPDFHRSKNEKEIYNFKILPWSMSIKLESLNSDSKIPIKNNSSKIPDEVSNTLINSDMIIDISGYALSSQWGFFVSLSYLTNLIVAKKYSIPYYIFPQSLGPFDYSLKQKIILYPLMKLYLWYPIKIYARENEGLKYMQYFTKRNLDISKDIVLLNNGYNLPNIYNENFALRDVKIEPNSVGIIPNIRVVERLGLQKINQLYTLIINKLINQGKTVYLLRHSAEDLEISQKLKDLYPDDKQVKLISDDFNALELENIIKQFDFIIASRFHSIVHSYKNGIPAIVIGWATKYFELLESFDQIDYFFDGRYEIDVNKLESDLEKMLCCYELESEKIIIILSMLNSKNVFDEIVIN